MPAQLGAVLEVAISAAPPLRDCVLCTAQHKALLIAGRGELEDLRGGCEVGARWVRGGCEAGVGWVRGG